MRSQCLRTLQDLPRSFQDLCLSPNMQALKPEVFWVAVFLLSTRSSHIKVTGFGFAKYLKYLAPDSMKFEVDGQISPNHNHGGCMMLSSFIRFFMWNTNIACCLMLEW